VAGGTSSGSTNDKTKSSTTVKQWNENDYVWRSLGTLSVSVMLLCRRWNVQTGQCELKHMFIYYYYDWVTEHGSLPFLDIVRSTISHCMLTLRAGAMSSTPFKHNDSARAFRAREFPCTIRSPRVRNLLSHLTGGGTRTRVGGLFSWPPHLTDLRISLCNADVFTTDGIWLHLVQLVLGNYWSWWQEGITYRSGCRSSAGCIIWCISSVSTL
jgi:hypothetical protein